MNREIQTEEVQEREKRMIHLEVGGTRPFRVTVTMLSETENP